MTFKQIELFVLVCQYESIARVSELNFVSPQSVSRMMKDLETELNSTLFSRTSNGIIPTEVGKYFRDECIEILVKKDMLIKNILQMNSDNKTTIHIGMALGSLAALNYHIFDEFEAINPNINIEYSEFIDCDLEERFVNNEFDFIIATNPISKDSYDNTKILTEQVYLSIPVEHDLYHIPNITMSHLENYEFAMFTDAYHIHDKFMKCFQETGFSPNIKIFSTDFNSIKNLAYQNNLLSLDVQHSLKKEHGFRHVPFPCKSLVLEFWIVRRIKEDTPIIGALCQQIIRKSTF
ncbi:MAG: LysR family transcriptional regulator [Eubacteriales bacterium]